MKNFPIFEVAISDADRAEIEAIYIELMRVRDGAVPGGLERTAIRPIDPPRNSKAA